MLGEFCSFVGSRLSAGTNCTKWPSGRRPSPVKGVGVIHAKL